MQRFMSGFMGEINVNKCQTFTAASALALTGSVFLCLDSEIFGDSAGNGCQFLGWNTMKRHPLLESPLKFTTVMVNVNFHGGN